MSRFWVWIEGLSELNFQLCCTKKMCSAEKENTCCAADYLCSQKNSLRCAAANLWERKIGCTALQQIFSAKKSTALAQHNSSLIYNPGWLQNINIFQYKITFMEANPNFSSLNDPLWGKGIDWRFFCGLGRAASAGIKVQGSTGKRKDRCAGANLCSINNPLHCAAENDMGGKILWAAMQQIFCSKKISWPAGNR